MCSGQGACGHDELYACLTARGDELLEPADAVLCAPGAVWLITGSCSPCDTDAGYGIKRGSGWRKAAVRQPCRLPRELL